MTATVLALQLQDGWSSSVLIDQTRNGRYAGTAELSFEGLAWGTLVFMQQPSFDAALAHVKLRAAQFARQRWLSPSVALPH